MCNTNCCQEKKYKSIPLTDVKVGDEVYSILKNWGVVEDIGKGYCLWITFPGHKRLSFTPEGRFFANDINPELTEARREIKTVQREMWGLKDNSCFGMYTGMYDNETIATELAKGFQLYTIPCRITWEEEA